MRVSSKRCVVFSTAALLFIAADAKPQPRADGTKANLGIDLLPRLKPGYRDAPAEVPLQTWWQKTGPWESEVRPLGRLPHGDLRHVWRTAGGPPSSHWQTRKIPFAVDLRGNPLANPHREGWLVSAFQLDPELQGQTLGLWLDATGGVAQVYINGNLVALGAQEVTLRGRSGALGVLVPAQILTPGRNTVVVHCRTPLYTETYRAALIEDPRHLARRSFWRVALPRALYLGLCAILLASGAAALWYAAHARDAKPAFFGIGNLGCLLFIGAWVLVWPREEGNTGMALGTMGLALSTPFHALFLRRHLGVHRRSAWELGAMAYAAITVLCWLVRDTDVAIAWLHTNIVVALLSAGWGARRALLAQQQGHPHGKPLARGIVLACAALGIDHLFEVRGYALKLPLHIFGIGWLMAIGGGALLSAFLQGRSDLAQALILMRQREGTQALVAERLARTAHHIDASTQSVLAAVKRQEVGSNVQAQALRQTQATIEGLVISGERITEAAQMVLESAERTQVNNLRAGETILDLSEHVQRITQVLEVIREISHKSDLLALNAALEGTRAGGHGRGFSKVAAQMHRLAEHVMQAVRDIQRLTEDIRDSTNESVSTVEEAAILAANTTSSARTISVITQQQQSATQRVSAVVEDVAKIAAETVSSGQTTLEQANMLAGLSMQLEHVLRRLDGDDKATEDRTGQGAGLGAKP